MAVVKTTYDFDQMLSNAREAYGEELLKMADEGLDFVFTYTDNVAPSTAAGKMCQKYPERCFNFGIAEPDQVGASCGLALSGMVVYSQVFGPFLPLRAADQIHTDIAYNDVNVRLIGTHAGVTSGGGPTHNVIADLAFYRAVPNLTIFVPADAGQCIKGIRQSYSFQGPMIIRINRGGSPNVYADQNYELEFGKAIETVPGSDLTIISSGSSVYWSMMGAKLLKERYGLSARVIDMHTIKPMDYAMIDKCADETGNVFTVEEHSVNGGLGGAVAEALCEANVCVPMGFVGVQDRHGECGPYKDLLAKYGLDAAAIAGKVRETIAKK